MPNLAYLYHKTDILADLGGGAYRAHALPYGTQFFRFCMHFHQKAPRITHKDAPDASLPVHALSGPRPPWVHAPPTGNPGSATVIRPPCRNNISKTDRVINRNQNLEKVPVRLYNSW